MQGCPIQNRYDFILLFDVYDGNPNGDPDANNAPRIDPETNQGLVTDVCLKRKIRNRVEIEKHDAEGFRIFIKEKAVLNSVMIEVGSKEPDLSTKSSAKGQEKAQGIQKRAERMCKTFYDVRTFGAVLSTGAKDKENNNADYSAGQVRGPVQLTFARSIDSVISSGHAITRMAVTNEADTGTMGRKYTIPYGLYRAHGFVIPSFAERTGFSEEDLKLLWKSVLMMFNEDPSSAHGTMSTCKLIVFKHDSALGNAQAAELFRRVKVSRKDSSRPARSFEDYKVEVNKDNLPAGVTILEDKDLLA